MASKRNTKRANPTPSLIQQLRDEICIPAIPSDWIPATKLADELEISISTLHRRMKAAGYAPKKFKASNSKASSVWCYKLTK